MLFCQWNSRVLRDGVDKNEADLRRQLRKTAEPIQNLQSVRENITESHVSRLAAVISATRSDSNSIMPRSSYPSEDLPRNGATSSSPTTSRDDEGNRVLVPEMIPQLSVQPSTGLGNLRNHYNSPSHVGDINQTGRIVGRKLHAEVAEDFVRQGIDNGDGMAASADVRVPETETGNGGYPVAPAELRQILGRSTTQPSTTLESSIREIVQKAYEDGITDAKKGIEDQNLIRSVLQQTETRETQAVGTPSRTWRTQMSQTRDEEPYDKEQSSTASKRPLQT